MRCRLCDEEHAGHCSRVVRSLRARISELEAKVISLSSDVHASPCLTMSNTDQSNACLTTLTESNKSNGFDKRAYQRDYMRKRRAK